MDSYFFFIILCNSSKAVRFPLNLCVKIHRHNVTVDHLCRCGINIVEASVHNVH